MKLTYLDLCKWLQKLLRSTLFHDQVFIISLLLFSLAADGNDFSGALPEDLGLLTDLEHLVLGKFLPLRLYLL